MNEANRAGNAREELARARTCLAEARTLEEAGLPYGAASRAYFAVFHGAQALLFSVGLEARTHHGVISLVSEHFVKPGTLRPEMGRLLSRMQRDREDADYLAGAVFTAAEAREMIGNAERFVGEAERLVAR
ncbi:MAG TPA: HEPN domain-containing protein [Thermoanaerobaculia bacterium]|nr:HEPN domain-containing protein [Thermoanaerobaculia bacterium]